MNKMGSGNLYSEGGFPDLDADVRSNYIMNTTLMGVEKADAILLIGSNPRIEAPVFNARYLPVCFALPAVMYVWVSTGAAPQLGSHQSQVSATQLTRL